MASRGKDDLASLGTSLRRRLKPLRTALAGPASQADRPGGARVAANAWRRAAGALEPPDKALGRLPRPPRYRLYGVYRRANAATVAAALEGASGSAALWALDEVAPALAGSTVGAGPGSRFANLNRAAAAAPPRPEEWVVVLDDDVRFRRGGLDAAVALASEADLDLAQASHGNRSHLNWSVQLHRPGSRVRLSRYVDQGPLLFLSPRARPRLLPWPEDEGMGWGVEATWGADRSLRIGTLDSIVVEHLRPVSWDAGYDVREEIGRAERLLESSGWQSWQELQKELARWWRWQQTPPWRGGPREQAPSVPAGGGHFGR